MLLPGGDGKIVLVGDSSSGRDPHYIRDHIDVEALVGVPKSTVAETGIGVTFRP